MKSGQDQMTSELNSLKDRVSSNDAKLTGILKKQDSLTLKYEKVNGEIHDINCKVERIEQDLEINASTINSQYERLLALERYSRGFNLRFYKISQQTDEDCIDTLEKIISNDLNLEAAIENARCIGPSRERRDILRKKKLLKNGIYISEDLIPEDRKRKNELKTVMRQPYESGKQPNSLLRP